ncbi:hypothetical protein SAMN05421824_0120 [Hyunsoonleella jejuensis]|uniref:Uncharacterized protein n=1 Tax=Hyunsoonleella jejuensis TaxID=419940 RepID=A0A1H9A363_9FLAO|nr:hypothetical protein [Hyunsoonleella jejuensis]SEP71055.1 hypothetical protein SAMN05421824_0120 [Hyunsoonleella jejuensis]
MKYVILVLTLVSFGLILSGFLITIENSEKCIGLGVVILFLLVFPLFTYYRWKDKNLKDYMLTKENLDKMRENQKENKY